MDMNSNEMIFQTINRLEKRIEVMEKRIGGSPSPSTPPSTSPSPASSQSPSPRSDKNENILKMPTVIIDSEDSLADTADPVSSPETGTWVEVPKLLQGVLLVNLVYKEPTTYADVTRIFVDTKNVVSCVMCVDKKTGEEIRIDVMIPKNKHKNNTSIVHVMCGGVHAYAAQWTGKNIDQLHALLRKRIDVFNQPKSSVRVFSVRGEHNLAIADYVTRKTSLFNSGDWVVCTEDGSIVRESMDIFVKKWRIVV